MDPFSMVVLIVAISCGASVAGRAVDAFGKKRAEADRRYLEAKLTELRQENAELKAWASDLILSFDSTLQTHETRLQTVERRALAAGATRNETHPEAETLEARAGR